MSSYSIALQKISALTPMLRPGLLEKSQMKLMRSRAAAVPSAPMPGSFGIKTVTKTSMVRPDLQGLSETMSPAKWKQTAKDLPLAILATGAGYGIGKTLAEVMGERLVQTGMKPPWLQAMPKVLAGVGLVGVLASSMARDGMARRREQADLETRKLPNHGHATGKKIAKDISDVVRKGDILIMSAKPGPDSGLGGLVQKVFGTASRAVQGGDLVHSALYAGGGNILDFRIQSGIQKIRLSDATQGLTVAVMRPNVTAKERDRAISKIEKAMEAGTLHYSAPQLLKTLAARKVSVGTDSQRLGNEICSTMISRAFRTKLVPGRVREAVVPSDFLKGPKLTHVMTRPA